MIFLCNGDSLCYVWGTVQADTKGAVVNLNVTLEHDRSISPRLRYIDVYDLLVMISCACGEILHLHKDLVATNFWGMYGQNTQFVFYTYNENNTGNVCITYYWRALVQSLLQRKAITITYCQCVFVALNIQHAMHMRRIILSSVASPDVLYLSTLPHKRHDFRKERYTYVCFLFSLQLLSETFLILRSERDLIKMYTGLHVQYLSLSSDLNETLIFWADFRKVLIKFHENSSSGSQVVPCGRTDGLVDRQTDGQAWRS